jgi:hypothetical protein
MRDPVSPRLPQFDRIEREDRLLDEIQCHAGDIAGLLAIQACVRETSAISTALAFCNLRLSAAIRS